MTCVSVKDACNTISGPTRHTSWEALLVLLLHYLNTQWLINLYSSQQLHHNCDIIPNILFCCSRNQICSLPPCLCSLPLRVLNASNNRLDSLPETIGQLHNLMELVWSFIQCPSPQIMISGSILLIFLKESWMRRNDSSITLKYGVIVVHIIFSVHSITANLDFIVLGRYWFSFFLHSCRSFFNLCSFLLFLQDVSCNDISALPGQIGRLRALRELNVRRNNLCVLPEGELVLIKELFCPTKTILHLYH